MKKIINEIKNNLTSFILISMFVLIILICIIFSRKPVLQEYYLDSTYGKLNVIKINKQKRILTLYKDGDETSYKFRLDWDTITINDGYNYKFKIKKCKLIGKNSEYESINRNSFEKLIIIKKGEKHEKSDIL